MRTGMTPLLQIRRRIFRATQAEMATVTGVNQGTWSRWERGLLEPTRAQLNRIRAEAKRRKIAWNDAWFFEVKAA